jgi:hypothetical protein
MSMWLARLGAVVGLGWIGLMLLWACAPAPAAPAPEAGRFGIELRAVRKGPSGEVPFKLDEVAHNGDRVAFYLRANDDGHVYVVEFFPDGAAQVIYPGAGQTAALRRGEELRIPVPGRWLELRGCPGEEHTFIIASRRPLDQAAPELEAAVGAVRKSPPPAEESCPESELAPPPAVPSTASADVAVLPPALPGTSATVALLELAPAAAPSTAARPVELASPPAPRPRRLALNRIRLAAAHSMSGSSRTFVEVGDCYSALAGDGDVAVIDFRFNHERKPAGN